MAGVAFAIPLFLFVCNTIPHLHVHVVYHMYVNISMHSATPRITFQYYTKSKLLLKYSMCSAVHFFYCTVNYKDIMFLCTANYVLSAMNEPPTALCQVN